jgi:hypothetical protein
MSESMEGVEVKIGRKTFVVPPVTVWAQEQLDKPLPEGAPRASMDVIFDRLVLLLEPNYPELKRDDLKRLVAIKRLGQTLKAVMQAATDGMEVAAPEGEAKGP